MYNTIQQGLTITQEEKTRILKDRARLLAREPDNDETTSEHLEIIEFKLAYEIYGIETAYVQEVYPLKELVPLPTTPRFVLGIINVRGKILSVIDIKKFFNLPEKGITDLNKVIIVQTNKPIQSEGPLMKKIEGMELGILADAILGVKLISPNDIQPSLPTLTGIREQYLKGITNDQVVILDAKKILTDSKIVVHEDV